MEYLAPTHRWQRFCQTLTLGLLILLAACTWPDAPEAPAEAIPPTVATVDSVATESTGLTPTPPAQEPTAMPTTDNAPAAEPMPVAAENPQPVELVNPGFEEQDADGRITGWESSGPPEAVLLEGNGRSGEFRLTHKSAAAYQVETRQTVTGLNNQWYTLRAWIRSSGGQNAAWVGLTCGGEERHAHVPSTSPGYRWLQLVVSNEVTDGECAISLYSDGNPDNWASFDDIELVPGRAALTILGADISSLQKSEDLGGIYRETDGTPGDALQILKDHGLNYARLRVWVDPADGYNSKETVLAMARRLAEKDIKLLVDFHYSDNWADPGKQIKPAAWADLDFEGLTAAVYDHTFDVCNSLVAQGTPPDMVQVGNEINAGLLWPDASYENFDNMAALLTAGYQAVKDCSPDTLVMLHIAEGGDNEMAKWWFGNITRRDVPFDLIGISYYPFWHGSLAELQYNLNDITERYGKDVVVVETAYAFTDQDKDGYPNIAESAMATPGYPFTPQGQRDLLRDVMAVVRAVPNGRGLGVFYWDATWTAVEGNGWDGSDPTTGNAWENQALFDFDDIVLPALDEYLNP